MTGWIEPRPDFLGGVHRARKEKPPAPDPDVPAVDYVPVRCPGQRCRSLDCPAYNVQPAERTHRIRYHKCRKCGKTFKSVEYFPEGNC